MKRTHIALMVFAAAGIIGLTAALVARPGKSAGDSCNKSAVVTHQITIKDGTVTPGTTYGKLCDRVVFTNTDSTTRLIAFGPHEAHQAYDGVEEKVLQQGEHLTVTLNEKGSFHFHDHLHDETEGYFTVR